MVSVVPTRRNTSQLVGGTALMDATLATVTAALDETIAGIRRKRKSNNRGERVLLRMGPATEVWQMDNGIAHLTCLLRI